MTDTASPNPSPASLSDLAEVVDRYQGQHHTSSSGELGSEPSKFNQNLRPQQLDLVWSKLGQTLRNSFGFKLFTILIYFPAHTRKGAGAVRIYSTRPDLHPLGRRQPTTGQNQVPVPAQRQNWIHQVIVEGKTWRGCTKEDLKGVFEDWELLWSAGLGSVLNIPLRKNGVTIGSLNILDKEHAYDTADLGLAEQIADVVAPCVQKVRIQVQQTNEHSPLALHQTAAEEGNTQEPKNSSARI